MYRVKATYKESYADKITTHCTMYSEEYDNAEQAEATADFIGGSLDERMADYWIETVIQRTHGGEWRDAIPTE